MSKATKFFVWLTCALVALALVLFGVGNLHSGSVQKAAISDKADQIKVLRQQRDQANARADVANTRADTATTRADQITRIALGGIQSLTCAQFRGVQVTAAFARLVYFSPNATTDQRKTVAPFITVPAAPKGCPVKPGG